MTILTFCTLIAIVVCLIREAKHLGNTLRYHASSKAQRQEIGLLKTRIGDLQYELFKYKVVRVPGRDASGRFASKKE